VAGDIDRYGVPRWNPELFWGGNVLLKESIQPIY